MQSEESKLFEKLQKAFLEDIIAAVMAEVKYLSLSPEEKRGLAYNLAFNVLSAIDASHVQDVEGKMSEAKLTFAYGNEDEGDEVRIIGIGDGTYMHEMMPSENDEIFNPEKEE